MNESIDWSSGWASNSRSIPTIAEIELQGTFRNSTLTTKALRIEVECNGIICEKSISLRPDTDFGNLFANLQQHYKGEPFSIVQDMIDNAWKI